ncbi:hypothetical protein ES703_09173 [subsurface metagenome]
MANPDPSPTTRWSKDRQPTVYNGGRPKGWGKLEQDVIDELSEDISGTDVKGKARKIAYARYLTGRLKAKTLKEDAEFKTIMSVVELIVKSGTSERASNVNINLRTLPTIPVDLKEFFVSKGMPEEEAEKMQEALLDMMFPEGEEVE